jgi:hypothetical protein
MDAPDHPLEPLLHAYLDGEADAEERARVEAELARDPSFAARHARTVSLLAALAAPVDEPPGEVRDAQIARAVAATVVDLDAARRGRRRTAVLGAAAAVAVVFLGISVVALGGDGDDDAGTIAAAPTAADGGARHGDGASPEIEALAADEGTAEADPAVTAAADVSDGSTKGPAEDPELAAAVAALLDRPDPADDGLRALDPACADAAVAAAGGSALASGTAVLAGREVVLVVGEELVAVVEPDVCAIRTEARS